MHVLLHDYAGHAFALQLSQALLRFGHHVTHAYAGGLLTPRGPFAQAAEASPGLSCLEVPMSHAYCRNKYKFFKRRGYEVRYGRRLAHLLKELRPDVVLSGNTPTEPQWALIQAANELGIPVVVWLQDFYSVAVAQLAQRKLPLVGMFAGWWYYLLDRRCFQHSQGIVAITEDFVPILRRFGVPPERAAVVPNWGPLDDLPLRARDNEWARQHGLLGKTVFLYSGTLAMKHNPDLLRLLAEEFLSEDGVRIVVVSQGPGADYLRTCRERFGLHNLLILDFQPFALMPEVFASADVLLSVLEPEAGVFSVPSKVLAYHCAARAILAAMPTENLASRIIAQAGSGRCVPPHDSAGFIRAARELAADPALRNRMGQNGRAYAERTFDINHIARRFESILKAACTQGYPVLRPAVVRG